MQTAMGIDLVDQLTEALASVEWATIDRVCPSCWAPHKRGHYDSCKLDATLTRAGLGTRDKRDAYRNRFRKG